MQGLQLTGYGDPADVIKLVDVPDVGAPRPDEVVIDVEASPVEPTDLYIVAGVYGLLPPLPHLLGAQGAGRVSAVGRNVKYLKEGDRCMVPPLSSAWVNKVKAEASFLRPLPSGDVNQLSMLGINPLTAYLLLTEFRPLKAGDWIIQNGANSSVGRAVIPIAKARGIRTVSVVRRLELVDEMTALGGDVVLIDGLDLPRRIAAATDKAKIELALDSVGGLATQRLLNSIVLQGTVIVYSAMSGEPLAVSNPPLVRLGGGRRLHLLNGLVGGPNGVGHQTPVDHGRRVPAFRGPMLLPRSATGKLDKPLSMLQMVAQAATSARPTSVPSAPTSRKDPLRQGSRARSPKHRLCQHALHARKQRAQRDQ